MNLGGGGGGGLMTFSHGVCHCMDSFFTFLECLTKKLDPFRNFCAYWRSNRIQNTILRAVLEKMAPIFKPISKIVDFLSKLGESNQSIQSSFALSFVPIKITDHSLKN